MTGNTCTEIVITGLGIVTPLGANASANRQALAAGASAVQFGRAGGIMQTIPHATCGEVHLETPLRFPKQAKYFSRSVSLAMKAAQEAVASSRIRDVAPERFGVYLGSGQTGMDYHQFARILDAAWSGGHAGDFGRISAYTQRLIDPYFSLRTLSNAAVFMLANEFGALGPGSNFVQSDTAGISALEAAWFDLVEDRTDAAIVGAHDSLLFPSVIQSLSGGLCARDFDSASRPFDRNSSGLAPSEGAAMFIVERRKDAVARRAAILADISSVDWSGHAASPETGRRMEAGCAPLAGLNLQHGDPTFLVAQGSGMPADDAVELAMLGTSGVECPVTAFKGATGYVGAASGAVEFALSMLAAHEGIVPPIARLRTPIDSAVRLVRDTSLRLTADAARLVLFSCGLGGQAAALSASLYAHAAVGNDVEMAASVNA